MEACENLSVGVVMPAPPTEGCLTLSGIPSEALTAIETLAAERGQTLKEIYSDIALSLIADIKAGEKPKFFSTYRGSVRKNVWVDIDVFLEVSQTAKQLGRSKSAFMLTAIESFMAANGKLADF